MKDLVIIGCGGFGREVADVVDAINEVELRWRTVGFVDDDPRDVDLDRVHRRGSTILGTLTGSAPFARGTHYVVAIGHGPTRERVAGRALEIGLTAATLVHPYASIGANVTIGAGSVICSHVDVGADSTIGSHVHLDRATQVGHDSILADYTTVHPAAVISGSCRTGTASELGTNCTL
ncbi:MAG: hypothetical protein H7290_11185, partial [Flavobacterium sp.]